MLIEPPPSPGPSLKLQPLAAGPFSSSASTILVTQKSNVVMLAIVPGTSTIAATIGSFAYALPMPPLQHSVLNASYGMKPPVPGITAHQR